MDGKTAAGWAPRGLHAISACMHVAHKHVTLKACPCIVRHRPTSSTMCVGTSMRQAGHQAASQSWHSLVVCQRLSRLPVLCLVLNTGRRYLAATASAQQAVTSQPHLTEVIWIG